MLHSPTIVPMLRRWLLRLEALADELLKWGPHWTARFGSLAGRVSPAWITLLPFWLVLIVPAIVLRGYHFEEGTVIALARGAIDDGQWLVPHHYGLRFSERPVLMSWAIAGLGVIFGGIEPWIARLPAVSSLLGAGVLVFYLVGQRASTAAALFGTVCFFISPAVLQKLITAEPDVMLSMLLFAAFVLWWDGQKNGRVTFARWLAIGAALVAAGLTKGPQPVAYFTLGIGVFLVIKQQWKDLPGFLLANSIAGFALLGWYIAIYQPGDWGIWTSHSRLNTGIKPSDYLYDVFHFIAQLTLELMPTPIVVVAFAIVLAQKRQFLRDDLVLALFSYALSCTVVLCFWPNGANTRFALPAVLAFATLAGLAFDRLRVESPRILDVGVCIAFLLASYAVAIGWIVMPLKTDLFNKSRVNAETMITHMRVNPVPLYAIFGTLNNNILAYVPEPIHVVEIPDFARLATPVWAYITAEEAAQVRKIRPDLSVSLNAVIHFGTDADLYFLQPK